MPSIGYVMKKMKMFNHISEYRKHTQKEASVDTTE